MTIEPGLPLGVPGSSVEPTSRVPALEDDEVDSPAREAFAHIAREGRKPIALYRVLANAPTFIDAFLAVGAAIRRGSQLDRALIELIILRIGQQTSSAYVWNHHHGAALEAGAGEDQIRFLGTRTAHPDVYSAAERMALDVVDAVHEISVADDVFVGLHEHFSARQSTEIVAIASYYESLARIIQGLAVQLEPNYRSVDQPGEHS